MNNRSSVELAHESNPDPIGAETLNRIYRMRKLNEWMWSRIEPWVGQRILEGGCGNGTMTEFLLDREFVLSVDFNPAHLEALSERYRNCSNLSVLQSDLSDPDLAKCADHRIDTIVCLNVLEHIDPHEKVLQSFFQVLQPGGRLVLLVPAYPKLFGTLDSALGHVRRYGKGELFDLLVRTGFTVEDHSYLNLFGVLGWWLNGKVLKRNLLPQGQLGLYEELVPLFAWLERLTGHSAGLSHIIIGRKPVE
ncbi:MAG: class I SAM-dependent methyltransferase [bacterium]